MKGRGGNTYANKNHSKDTSCTQSKQKQKKARPNKKLLDYY